MSDGVRELRDPDLIEAVRSGDRAAIAHALSLCLPSLRRVVSARLGLPQEACEEVLQEVQVAFLLAAPRFRGECSLHTYLVQIACRKCADYVRAQRREETHRRALEVQETQSQGAVWDQITDKLAIEYAFASLGARERRMLELFYGEAKSYKEIAAELGLAIGSVGALKAEALAKLRVALSEPSEPRARDGAELR